MNRTASQNPQRGQFSRQPTGETCNPSGYGLGKRGGSGKGMRDRDMMSRSLAGIMSVVGMGKGTRAAQCDLVSRKRLRYIGEWSILDTWVLLGR